ncbi:hypothetical protein V493_00285 [Pseudogymnoascus sp. VKM F-4281 (FW-2241)]|nr:hypothetical protein V493_00285 [Pseudogymnoascus sp. VKM F-4281 (FW-2241)]
MPQPSREVRIILAIDAIQSSNKLSVREACRLYNVPRTSVQRRMNSHTARAETHANCHILTATEEEAIVRYVLDLDMRGFPPRIASVEDMANLLLALRGTALCEDSKLMNKWFQLVSNMRMKYGIQDCDFYNFDETGFMMGIISAAMVVTRSNRRGRSKSVQPSNREWAIAIECANANGWCIPLFLIVQGAYHLANWYTKGDLPQDWTIKPTSNGWTNNETGLEWIKHFDKHT